MTDKIQKGQHVIVLAFGRKQLERVVVEDLGETVVICTEQEFGDAQAKQKPPIGVGFPKDAVLEVKRKPVGGTVRQRLEPNVKIG